MTSGRPVAVPKINAESGFAPFSISVLPFPSSSLIYACVKKVAASNKCTHYGDNTLMHLQFLAERYTVQRKVTHLADERGHKIQALNLVLPGSGFHTT